MRSLSSPLERRCAKSPLCIHPSTSSQRTTRWVHCHRATTGVSTQRHSALNPRAIKVRTRSRPLRKKNAQSRRSISAPRTAHWVYHHCATGMITPRRRSELEWRPMLVWALLAASIGHLLHRSARLAGGSHEPVERGRWLAGPRLVLGVELHAQVERML